jgi:hypothetical protein
MLVDDGLESIKHALLEMLDITDPDRRARILRGLTANSTTTGTLQILVELHRELAPLRSNIEATVVGTTKELNAIVGAFLERNPVDDLVTIFGLLTTALSTVKDIAETSQGAGIDADVASLAVDVGSKALSGDAAEACGVLLDFVPVLGAISSGTKMLVLAKNTYAAHGKKKLAKRELKKMDELFKDRKVPQGLVNAMMNETNARDRVYRQLVGETTGAGLTTAGNVADFFVPGAGNAIGLVTEGAGCMVTYGSKAIVARVKYQEMEQVKALFKKAVGGDAKARIKLFKKSATYSKTLVAIMAEREDPWCLELIEARGLEEIDLKGPMGVQIMRDALMKHASQRDDQAGGSVGFALFDTLI